MGDLTYAWQADDGERHELRMVRVPGTGGTPYLFGAGPHRRPIEIADFHIGVVTVTQALWTHVMGSSRVAKPQPRHPATEASWHHITEPGGFLDRINASGILAAVAGADSHLRFRLPSESEWEYAARGGPHWRDDFAFSGSNDPDLVAWYGPRWTKLRTLGVRLFGWRIGWRILGRFPTFRRPTGKHDVATKAPNQLGIYDMSGNVWEWCQDVCVDDLAAVPADGSPYLGPGDERRLRGGSQQNWDLHCRVWWRYGITPDAHESDLGFRVVLG